MIKSQVIATINKHTGEFTVSFDTLKSSFFSHPNALDMTDDPAFAPVRNLATAKGYEFCLIRQISDFSITRCGISYRWDAICGTPMRQVSLTLDEPDTKAAVDAFLSAKIFKRKLRK